MIVHGLGSAPGVFRVAYYDYGGRQVEGVNELSWRWIVVMLIAPSLGGGVLAFLVWQTRQYVLGNLAGAGVIFGSALALILRESVEIDRVTRACLEAGYTCWPEPTAFTRYAIYAFIGLLEVIAVFGWSLRVERKIRDRNYAPEWR